MIELMPASKMAPGEFNEGEILELRPIIYGHPGKGFSPYSNLFYWAHAWSDEGSTIGLHPHKGFEILSYVVKGSLEHYDTLLKKWIPLNEGSAQIIRSGNGISHSEKINRGSRMFQIWFDPNLRKSLDKKASYNDYASGDFPKISTPFVERTIIIGEKSPLKVDSNLKMERLDIEPGDWTQEIPVGSVLSWFQISGDCSLNGMLVPEGDFARINKEQKVRVHSDKKTVAFLIISPEDPGYETYA